MHRILAAGACLSLPLRHRLAEIATYKGRASFVEATPDRPVSSLRVDGSAARLCAVESMSSSK